MAAVLPANFLKENSMEDDSILLTKINDLAPQLNTKHRAKILSQIILLIEAQRQGIYDFPLSYVNRRNL